MRAPSNTRPEVTDDVIDQIRAVREAYAARFDYDIAALFLHAQEAVKRSDRPVVHRSPKTAQTLTDAH